MLLRGHLGEELGEIRNLISREAQRERVPGDDVCKGLLDGHAVSTVVLPAHANK